jgi:glucose/arabinose dehydrogenase
MRLALAVALTLVFAAPAGAARVVPFASGFDQPTYLTTAPGDAKTLYVVEQPGRILALRGGKRTVFLDIRSKVKAGGEQGLLSVAFHPRYATNHRYYVNYTDTNGDTRVVEYPSGRQLLFVDQPYENHNGGQLQFGPDGLLYVGMGDGGSGGDPGNRAQNLGTPLGKLLRIDPLKAGARWFAAGYGLRNPWRFSFDRKTGDLWIGDVGQGAWEEVDARTRKQLSRRWNYGWSILEGRHRYKQGSLNRNAPYVAPVFEYSHSTGGCSITGGYVYRGKAVPAAAGRYFFGDYCNGRIWSLKNGKARVEPFRVPNIASFGEDAAGELYQLSLGGSIYKLAR